MIWAIVGILTLLTGGFAAVFFVGKRLSSAQGEAARAKTEKAAVEAQDQALREWLIANEKISKEASTDARSTGSDRIAAAFDWLRSHDRADDDTPTSGLG
jgi:flagellar basal body-associated protein FliL